MDDRAGRELCAVCAHWKGAGFVPREGWSPCSAWHYEMAGIVTASRRFTRKDDQGGAGDPSRGDVPEGEDGGQGGGAVAVGERGVGLAADSQRSEDAGGGVADEGARYLADENRHGGFSERDSVWTE